MTKILLWGGARTCRLFIDKVERFYSDYVEIVGVTDSFNLHEVNGIEKYNYISVENITKLKFDIVVVTIASRDAVINIKQFIRENFSYVTYVRWYRDYENELRTLRINEKYKNSDEMKGTLEWINKNGLSVRNQYQNFQKTIYPMEFDKVNGYPFIMFEDKKVYYPRDYWIGKAESERKIVNFEEVNQYPESPHLYTFDEHNVSEGDYVVDAGVCEGNFAIKHIEKAGKMWLIESDERWHIPLTLTFEPWKEKCVFVWKNLDDYIGRNSVFLDYLLQNEARLDFVKMDIEGSECRALLGGLDVLKKYHPKLSICAYHRQNDARNIKFILESIGYKTSTSHGTMFFPSDDTDYSLDFRKGMVYGD